MFDGMLIKRANIRFYFYTNWAKRPFKKYLKSFVFNSQSSNMLDIYTRSQLRVLGFTIVLTIYK